MDVTALMLEHDSWVVGQMLERASDLPDQRLDQPITVSIGHPGRSGGLDGITDTATLRSLLAHLVWQKEMWLAAPQDHPRVKPRL